MSVCFPKGWERRHEAPGANGYRFGSKSSSKSSSSYSTTNTDSRAVVDGSGIAITGSLSNTNLTLTDHGVIDAAQAIIAQQTQTNATAFSNMLATLNAGHRDNAQTLQLISDTFESVADESLSTITNLVERAFDAADNTANLSRELVSLSNEAYADAASQAQGNKNLVYAGLLIAGVVAISVFQKG